MRQTVIGFFDSSTEAQQAVEKLAANGFTIDQVDITYNNDQSVLDKDENTYSTSESTLGNSTLGDRTSRTADQDDGFGDKISRFFRSLFDDDDERSKYERVARNAAIVTVLTDSEEKARRASEVLDDCGAVDIDERSSEYERQSMGSTQSMSSTQGMDTTSSSVSDTDLTDRSRRTSILDTEDSVNSSEKSIPIVEESLQVGKREVERGGVRVRSRIIERPVEETLRLREERIRVDRNPVNRPATEGDLSTFREGEIELKQRSEVPVVNKEARVVEEVNLNREVTEREEVIRDTVRKTEVEIDENVEESDLDREDLKIRRSKNSSDNLD